MTQRPGWYDDPQDPSQLRYWDGVIWSSNVTPKAAPSGGQFGMAPSATPPAARPEVPGSYGAQDLPSAPGSFGSPQQGYGQQGGLPPAYGQGPGYAPQQSGSGWQSNPVPSTPDGVPLSGWWKRVLAQIIDRIIVFIVTLPLTFGPLRRAKEIFGDAFKEAMDSAKTGSTTSPRVSEQLAAQMGAEFALVSIILLVVFMVYQVAFLTLTGATPGKMAVGISVRLRDVPGPPPLLAVLKRTFVMDGVSLGGALPVIGGFLSPFIFLFRLLNVLWPLWDEKKQAIHDKVAKTNVVVGPQPKRNA